MSPEAPPRQATVNPEAAIIGDGVRLAYGEQTVLAPSDFTIPSGRVTAVIGPNGAGKSTFLDASVGLVRPVSGRLQVLGGSPRASRRRVAYVLQAAKVNERLPVTVREVVGMGRYATRGALGRFRPHDLAAVNRALDLLDIGDLAGRHLGELSAGQRQRVFVAQGLAQEAELLLMDEPVTGLDLVSAERILAVVAATRERGITVVVATHDLTEASAADHVLLLAGRVVAEGEPGEVITTSHLATAYGAAVLELAEGTFALDDPHHTHHAHPQRRQARPTRQRHRSG